MASTPTQSPEHQASQPKPRDFRREVTDNIVAMLEKGVAPWQKPWQPGVGSFGMPVNPTTNRPYRGGNAIHLMATALRKGYDDPRWMTYKQAEAQGWQVRRGEKGTQIEFWDAKPAGNAAAEDERSQNVGRTDRSRFVCRIYTIFNAKQTEGVPALETTNPSKFEVVRAGEQILNNSGASISHDQADRAFYNRTSDTIHLPPKQAFKDATGYYGTALHELAHWTGHPSRLNRASLNESYRFGDGNYAKEELRAELASVFLAAQRGIPHNPEQHAAYVSSWIKALKEDKNEIFRAAHDASKAADFLLSLEREKSIGEEELAAQPVVDPAGAGRSGSAVLEQEAEEIHRDRERLEEYEPEPAESESAFRESTENVARFEPESGTVNVHAKESATDRRTTVGVPAAPSAPVRSSDSNPAEGPRNGSKPRAPESLKTAEAITAMALGESAKTLAAQVQSGSYRGLVIGETDQFVIQRQSAHSAIAHPKELLDRQPAVGELVRINYSNSKGSVREYRERAKANEITR